MIDNPPPLPYRIFCVDPAIGFSGWSVLEITSWSPFTGTIIDHGQLIGDKLLRTMKEHEPVWGRQFCMLDALELEYDRLITLHKPHRIVSESAFGYKHAQVIISLTLVINYLRRLSRKLLGRDIVLVPPTISKKAWTGSGGADKDKMRKAYEHCSYLVRSGANQISEHEIDSIAHGIGHVFRDILQIVQQVSAKDRKQAKKEKKNKT